jgi:mRNA interferase YafQ
MKNFSSTSQYRKDEKRMIKQLKDMNKIDEVLNILIDEKPLHKKYLDHELKNKNPNQRELHIESDWLLLYCFYNNNTSVKFIRTGSHSELFKK